MEKKSLKKGTKISLIFILIVIVITLVGVLRNESPADLAAQMKKADPACLIMAVVCVLGFLMMQGVIIWLMCRSLNLKESLWRCMLMAFHGYFFCNITPMQTGGPVVQIYDMKKEGIRFPTACMLIFNMTFLFKLVLFIICFGFLFFGEDMLKEYTGGIQPLVVLGFILTITFTLFIGIMIFNTKLTKKLAIRFFDWTVRKHWQKHNIEARRAKMLNMFDQYKDVAGFFKTHLKLMGVLLLLTFAQRFMYFSSTWFVYKSFGLKGTGWFTICMLQSLINIIADLLPVPGDVGVGEMVFIVVFDKIFGSYTNTGLLLSRGITYYSQLLICGVMTIVASITFRMDRSKAGMYKNAEYFPDKQDEEEESSGDQLSDTDDKIRSQDTKIIEFRSGRAVGQNEDQFYD
ncbi:MAG: lysylphosphatidylglycerol synthase transmembrane domain-containing protein [Eubacteriales bacterium]|jgi:uncharacterized protein (TIRG00374 family)